MAAKLEQLGFAVDLAIDADQETMLLALDGLQRRLAGGGIAFFHYGGHGVQSQGRNYLIPVDANIPDERFLRTRAVDLAEVMIALEVSGSDTNVVVLDACRDNPIPSMARSGTRGLSVVENKPANSIIVYSAQAGSVARDGVFTPSLLRHMDQPVSFTEVLQRVQRDVQEATGRTQRPGAYTELLAPLFLAGKETGVRSGLAGDAPARDAEVPDGFVRVDSGWFDFSLRQPNASIDRPYDTWLSPYYIAVHEVTFEEYDAFCNATGWMPPLDNGWGRGKRPVMHVSFLDAVAYCNWRSEQEGLTPAYSTEDGLACDFSANGYRLPTVAEWEYAAREARLPLGAFLKDPPIGNVRDVSYFRERPDAWGEPMRSGYDDGFPSSSPVGSFAPNALGLYDMDGNVSEMCWDYKDVSFAAYAEQGRNPVGAEPSWGADNRSIRGPNWSGEFSDYGFVRMEEAEWLTSARADGSDYGAVHNPETDTVGLPQHVAFGLFWTSKSTVPWVGFRLVRSVTE